jgi:hypothetical protein
VEKVEGVLGVFPTCKDLFTIVIYLIPKVDDEEYVIMREEEILAVLTKGK